MSTDFAAEENLRAGLRAQLTESFEELLDTYEQSVYSLCSLLTKDEQQCEQAICMLLRKIIADAPKLPDNLELRIWVLKTAVECVLQQEETVIQELNVPIESIQVSVIHNEPVQEHGIRGAVMHLPAEYRVVFVLREVLRLAPSEIAVLVSMSEFEVRGYLHRARLMMSRQLRRNGGLPTAAVVVESAEPATTVDAKYLN